MKVKINRDEVLRLAQDLIATESHVDAAGRETAVGHRLVAWLESRGLGVERQVVDGERANVIARLPGDAGRSLMLNGHLDTVPAGDMPDAFTPRIEDGVLWGRGACDMKGAIAAMCGVLAAIRRCEVRPPGDLVFAGTIGEELGSIGVKHLVESGHRADCAVVGEPTGLRIAVAHKGVAFIRIALRGRGAHGSVPEEGVNAASYAARIAIALEEALRPRLDRRLHPLLGRSTVNVGRICGGTQPNIVAERCEIHVDRRILPGEPAPIDEIRLVVEDVCGGVEGLTVDLVEMPSTAEVPHVPLGSDPSAPLAQAAQFTCRTLGLPEEPIGVTYWTDGGHLAESGFETIVLGPGSIADAHGPEEHAAVGEILQAAEIYLQLALRGVT